MFVPHFRNLSNFCLNCDQLSNCNDCISTTVLQRIPGIPCSISKLNSFTYVKLARHNFSHKWLKYNHCNGSLLTAGALRTCVLCLLVNPALVRSNGHYDGKSVSVIVICEGYFWPSPQDRQRSRTRDSVKISKICLFVLMWSTNVTDGRVDIRNKN